MTVVDVYNLAREKTSEMELNDLVFDVPIKSHILHQVVVAQLNNRRSGTASTKSRSEVKASGKKLWRQKGTGRARVGGASSPTRRGGGVAFGPVPRDYSVKVPKKIRKAAVRMALTDKVKTGLLMVLEDFALPEIKTKAFVKVMNDLDLRKTLIVTENENDHLERSSKNVPWVKVMRYQGLNAYDILRYDHLCVEKSAISKIEEALVP
jgi:large subunit ribosomal protein L4